MTVETDEQLEILEKIIFECIGDCLNKLSGEKRTPIDTSHQKRIRNIIFSHPNSNLGYFNITITDTHFCVSYRYDGKQDAVDIFESYYKNKLPESQRISKTAPFNAKSKIDLYYKWGLDNPNIIEESQPIIKTIVDFFEDPYLDYIR
jgi:hypothetical protein